MCDPGLACIHGELDPDCDQNFAGCCSPYCDLDNPDCGGNVGVCASV